MLFYLKKNWFVFQANRNCIAIASSHDVQELDVSGILATQIYTWVDDDIEMEAKGYFHTWFYLFSNARDFMDEL
jgi:hypothetical protein